MLRKTQGIAIHYIKYRETSIIIRIFTRELGLKSYVVNSVRSSKSRSNMALYQPLTLLDLVVYDKEGASINRISEAKLAYAFQRIPFDFYRSGVAMFVGEVLSKAIYESYQNEGLYDFLTESLTYLDRENVNLSLYPLLFLLQLSVFLGFAPESAHEFYEQLRQGARQIPFDKEEELYLDKLIASTFDTSHKVPAMIRRRLLDHVLLFYKLHMETFSEVKSLKVLTHMMH
jgi:DNA repair protein RecO (recombination protein O)